MTQILKVLLILTGAFLLQSSSLIDDLKHHIAKMQDQDELMFEYTYEGCFGPYHHGSIKMKLVNDTIYFLEKNFDHQGAEGISQAGQYYRRDLINRLQQAKGKNSDEILGVVINYRVTDHSKELFTGTDRIEQSHFVAIFQPFTSIISPRKKGIIPGLPSGGFVN